MSPTSTATAVLDEPVPRTGVPTRDGEKAPDNDTDVHSLTLSHSAGVR